MSDRESFLLRIDSEVLEALRLWARDELRSVNGQIDYLLRRVLREAGRLRADPQGDRGSSARRPSGRKT